MTIKDNKFTMPSGNVEVEAIFEKAFRQVRLRRCAEGSFYYDAVLWAVEKGVTTGTSATTLEARRQLHAQGTASCGASPDAAGAQVRSHARYRREGRQLLL